MKRKTKTILVVLICGLMFLKMICAKTNNLSNDNQINTNEAPSDMSGVDATNTPLEKPEGDVSMPNNQGGMPPNINNTMLIDNSIN